MTRMMFISMFLFLVSVSSFGQVFVMTSDHGAFQIPQNQLMVKVDDGAMKKAGFNFVPERATAKVAFSAFAHKVSEEETNREVVSPESSAQQRVAENSANRQQNIAYQRAGQVQNLPYEILARTQGSNHKVVRILGQGAVIADQATGTTARQAEKIYQSGDIAVEKTRAQGDRLYGTLVVYKNVFIDVEVDVWLMPEQKTDPNKNIRTNLSKEVRLTYYQNQLLEAVIRDEKTGEWGEPLASPGNYQKAVATSIAANLITYILHRDYVKTK